MKKLNKNIITVVVMFALVLSIGGILIHRHVQERARVASMERMNQGIERILAVVESKGIHAINDIVSIIDEDESLSEAEKTRLKQRFSWATSALRSGGGISYAEEGLTLDSSLFINLVAIEQRLGIPPAQTLRYLLGELDEANRYPWGYEREQIMGFVTDEGQEGTF